MSLADGLPQALDGQREGFDVHGRLGDLLT
jgi:hypothetical protein